MSRKILMLITVVLASLTTVKPVLAENGALIDSVCVIGARFVPEERVLLEFGISAGDNPDRESLAEGIRRLYRSHRFSGIDLLISELPGSGFLLTLVIEEYPRIVSITWEGLKKIKSADVEKEIRVTTGSYARPLLIETDKRAIIAHCREKGYHAAIVTSQLDVDERGRGSLTFVVDEGSKTKIKDIEFTGNEYLSDSDLMKTISSKPKRIYNPKSWFNSNSYQPDSVSQDVSRIMERYHQEGLLDAKITSTDTDFNESNDRISLNYRIEEGPQYLFGTINWQGNAALPDSIIEEYLYFEEGSKFSGYRLDFAIMGLSNWLYDVGYLYNQVYPERQVDGDKVSLLIRINEGSLARVRDITISGNSKTRDKVIRREVKIFPGELFNRNKLVRSQRDIYMLRYFDDVQLDPRPDPATGDVDLNFRVVERNSGKFGAGVTYSEARSMTGFIQLGAQNFRGLGESLDFQWEFGERVHLFNISLIKPWFRDLPMTLNTSVYRSRSNLYRDYYEDEKMGFSFGIGRAFPWLEYTRVSLSYRLESMKLFNFSESYIAEGGTLTQRDWPEIESSSQLTFWRNSTDSPFLPGKGTRFRISAKLAGGPLGGNLAYQKYMCHYTWYQRLVSKFVLRYHQTLGLVDGLGSANDVPDQETFRLGGNRVNPVRGYEDYSIVPHGNSNFLGGRAMTTGTVEVILGVNNSIQIIMPFFDFGNTWNSLSQADFTTLRRSVGIGARIEVPMMGVMGFDWGYPFDPQGGPDKGRFQFKMGTDF
ncbi:MAG: outer membrane protein assembly factor BamA [bacterium]|nr:outer membrane protein assembly factor BamA [bacterium]